MWSLLLYPVCLPLRVITPDDTPPNVGQVQLDLKFSVHVLLCSSGK